MECEGNDYEKQICSREEELADQVRALLDENEVLGKNKCRAVPGRKITFDYSVLPSADFSSDFQQMKST